MTVVDLPVEFGTKPYSGADDKKLPPHVKKMPSKRRRQWIQVFNSELAAHGDEGRAFAAANSVASGSKTANHTGVMLALYPSIGAARKLAIPGGEPPKELHVTLLYFGDVKDIKEPDLYRIQVAAQQAAVKYAPFTAQMGGLGRFYTTDEDGNNAFYTSVDASSLPGLRQDLATRLEGLFANNHGFSPHMTLKYVKLNEPNPIESWTPTKVKFNSIQFMVAGIEKTYPLTGWV